MNDRSLRKQQKIERILDHGIEAFRKYGYHSSSVQDLADFCQISKGSFYQYFESKEHFCREVIKHYSRRMDGMVTQIINNPDLNGIQKLETFYRAAIDMVKNSDYKTGCLYGDLSAELGGVNHPCSDTLNSCVEGSCRLFEKAILEGQKDGSIRKDIAATTLASLSFFSFTGYILRMKVERSTAGGEEFLATFLKQLLSSN